VEFERMCDSDAATQAAGVDFAAVVRPGDVVLLSGPLGAGKTTFVKGVARGLGVRERVTSPTFTMVRQHEAHHDSGITTVHHADVYRVESLGEVRDLDLGELVEESGLALVEWGDLATSVFGAEVLEVAVEVDDVTEWRRLRVTGLIDPARASALATWSGA
jgi:tRNA threonylcarbamoyladenosine biosynthesis protein TsaE